MKTIEKKYDWKVTEISEMPETRITSIKYCIKQNGGEPLVDIRRFIRQATYSSFLPKQGFTFNKEGLRTFIDHCKKLYDAYDALENHRESAESSAPRQEQLENNSPSF